MPENWQTSDSDSERVFGVDGRGGDLITNIELKNSVYYYGGMEEKVIDMICEYGLEDRDHSFLFQ